MHGRETVTHEEQDIYIYIHIYISIALSIYLHKNVFGNIIHNRRKQKQLGGTSNTERINTLLCIHSMVYKQSNEKTNLL